MHPPLSHKDEKLASKAYDEGYHPYKPAGASLGLKAACVAICLFLSYPLLRGLLHTSETLVSLWKSQQQVFAPLSAFERVPIELWKVYQASSSEPLVATASQILSNDFSFYSLRDDIRGAILVQSYNTSEHYAGTLVDITISTEAASLSDIPVYSLRSEHSSYASGLAISPSLRHLPNTSVNVTIRVPRSCGAMSMSERSAFRARSSGFSYRFDDIPEDLRLSIVDVSATGGSVHAQNLRADKIDVNASSAPITGFFNITSSLKLSTTNSPIDVEVSAYKGPYGLLEIKLETMNAALTANVSLYNTSDSSAGVTYSVRGRTLNAPLNITVPHIPIYNNVQIEALTANAPAYLSLGPAFEGTFQVATANALPTIEHKEVSDPARRGRQRAFEMSGSTGDVVSGEISWVPRIPSRLPSQKSSVSLTTVNAPAIFIA